MFGYEEALGYLVDPDKVRDKDGISAAVAILSLFSELQHSGTSLDEHFAQFAERFGGYASAQISIRVDDVSEIAAMMAALRAQFPSEVVESGWTRSMTSGKDSAHFRRRSAAPAPGRRRSRHRPAERHRTEAQVLSGRGLHDGTAAQRIAAATATVASLETGMRALLGPAARP